MSALKRRIAILGGGPAGLAAAWALTSSTALRARIDVTIYEARDRPGGKCATGRGDHGRIEEHGVHLLQGWYHNTFRMLRAAYRARIEDRTEHDAARGELDAWFVRQSSMLFSGTGPRANAIESAFVFPDTDDLPGDGVPRDDLGCLVRLVGIGFSSIASQLGADAPTPVTAAIEALARWPLERALRSPLGLAGLRATLAVLGPALALAARPLAPGSRTANLLGMLRIAHVLLHAVLADVWDPAPGVLAYDRIDNLDLSAWLRRHGADDEVLDGPLLRFLYNVLLANRPDDGRALSAAAALRLLVRAADYRGAFFWRPREGTGDSVILPLVEALGARGVRFCYGHRLDALEVDAQHRVSALALAVADGFGPSLGLSRGRPSWVGPRHADAPPRVPRRLVHGVDFDEVILAMPPSALAGCVDALEDADPRWRAMVRGIECVPSAHAQLWFRRGLAAHGWDPRAAGAAAAHDGLVTTLRRPFQSWADMSHALATEEWEPGAGPEAVLYLTCACEPQWGTDRGPATDAFRAALGEFLDRDPRALWVGREAPPPGWPKAALHGDGSDDHWDAQYFSANVDVDERYVLARPGGARLRLAPDDAGFANLALAGDWTAGGLRAGCVEGAVTSGFEAADAVLSRTGLASEWAFHRYVA